MITIKNLVKKINKEIFFKIENFCFEELAYQLVGANGSGKTLLVNIITGLDKKVSGSVINTHSKLPVLYLGNDGIGFPFLSIEENIQLAAKLLKITLNKSYETLFEDRNLLEQKYDISSFGTQKKVGLSLLFSNEKYGLIVLDEALSGVDAQSRKIIEKKFGEMNCTRILVSHERLGKELKQKIKELSINEFKI